ncbi:MAG: hypothetical protein ACREBS_08600 [Nitrososphaerales archaeon]
MVTIVLNNLQFEAEKFETRTMPTPNMKGKEVIYWIKMETGDKRLASNIQKFLEGASKFIDLRVPSAFIFARTELENFTILPSKPNSQVQRALAEEEDVGGFASEKEEGRADSQVVDRIRLEILLRRTLPETPERQTQSPYG